MKELLHSKGFKKNLKKWLFMYCGVMVVLTIVVTYSRYISSKAMNDNARVAKFDVSIKPSECTSTEANHVCFDNNLIESRPAEYVDFYYTVDTTNLEVATKLVTTIRIRNQEVQVINPGAKYFSYYELYDVGNNKNVPVTRDGDTITVVEDIMTNEVCEKKYRLTMKYNYQAVGYASEKLVENLISIDYAATQID